MAKLVDNMKKKPLTQKEFDRIQRIVGYGLGFSTVAKVVGRSHSTVRLVAKADSLEDYKANLAETMRRFRAKHSETVSEISEPETTEQENSQRSLDRQMAYQYREMAQLLVSMANTLESKYE